MWSRGSKARSTNGSRPVRLLHSAAHKRHHFETAQPAPAGTVYCENLLGNGGRNEIYGPGLIDFDFSLFKDNKIRENLNLQFRAEFFNVFNHANFNSPIANSTLFDNTGAPVGNAGAFDSTSTSSREIQFALKLIF